MFKSCLLKFVAPLAALAFCQPVQAQIRIDRLEKLAVFLDTKAPQGHFDIQSWGNMSNPDDPNYIGCCAGWSTKIFNQDGFAYGGHDSTTVKFQGESCLKATQLFFGLNDFDNWFLFTGAGSAGTSPHKAAMNIRQVIEKHRPKLADLPYQVFTPSS